jgi:glycosyltransferase involved in cell wall biosynthesis
MSTLRLILDELVVPVPGDLARYTASLAEALIATAPRGSSVAGVVSAVPEDELTALRSRFGGLAALHTSRLTRRQLAAAWQHGFTPLPGTGFIHAPSLLAPLRRHDSATDPESQTVVTIHDAFAWTHPEAVAPRDLAWHRAMARRAERFADAVVVPSHAAAADLAEVLDLGDRLRVIGGAVPVGWELPADADRRAEELVLPERFVLAVASADAERGLPPLIGALAGVPDVLLVVIGPDGGIDGSTLAVDAGVDPERVRLIGPVRDDDLAVLYSRAAAFVVPGPLTGFAAPVLAAFHFGTPVVHLEDPGIAEVTGGAALAVGTKPEGLTDRLADAIRSILEDDALAARLRTEGRDRAGVFTWRDSAEKTWQLHADI